MPSLVYEFLFGNSLAKVGRYGCNVFNVNEK